MSGATSPPAGPSRCCRFGESVGCAFPARTERSPWRPAHTRGPKRRASGCWHTELNGVVPGGIRTRDVGLSNPCSAQLSYWVPAISRRVGFRGGTRTRNLSPGRLLCRLSYAGTTHGLRPHGSEPAWERPFGSAEVRPQPVQAATSHHATPRVAYLVSAAAGAEPASPCPRRCPRRMAGKQKAPEAFASLRGGCFISTLASARHRGGVSGPSSRHKT